MNGKRVCPKCGKEVYVGTFHGGGYEYDEHGNPCSPFLSRTEYGTACACGFIDTHFFDTPDDALSAWNENKN